MTNDNEGVTMKQKNTKCFSINKKMLPSKLAYFVYFSAWGSYLPFINIFLVSTGLTYREAGFISGMCYACQAIACPLWGFLADATGRRKLIFIVLCVGSAITVVAQPWVAWKVNSDHHQTCPYNKSITTNTSQMVFTKNNNTNGEYMNISTVITGCILHRKPFSNTLFFALMTMFILEQCLTGPLINFLDSLIMKIVSESNDPTSFGVQRVYGSIGFGVSSFVAGVLADNFSHETLSKYSPVFFMAAPLFILMIPLGYILLLQTNWKESGNEVENADDAHFMIIQKAEASKLKQVVDTIKIPRNILFFISVLVAGIAFSIYWSFVFLLLFETMHASKTVMGLTSFTSSISEILMFPFSGKLIRFFGSPLPCIELGIAAFAVRLTLLSYIENSWLTLPVQLLHSLSFALMWAAAVEFVHSISPKAIYSTMFGVLVSIMFGVAAVIGNMVGGVLYHQYGGQALFRGTAVFAGGWLIIMVLTLHVFKWISLTIDVSSEQMAAERIDVESEKMVAERSHLVYAEKSNVNA